MKIRPISDLHLEFYGKRAYPRVSPLGEDVLVLAGDIHVNFCDKFLKWLGDLLEHRDIIYIPGNHEYYQRQKVERVNENFIYYADLLNTGNTKKNLPYRIYVPSDNSGGYHIKEKEGITYKFIYCTLWSYISPVDELFIRDRVNDYSMINYQERLLTPWDTTEFHKNSVDFLTKIISGKPADKTIIITHHAPSFASISNKFKGNRLNTAYASGLERLMPGVNLWIHGHMHDSSDYVIEGCRVICNPKGYVDACPGNTSFKRNLIAVV